MWMYKYIYIYIHMYIFFVLKIIFTIDLASAPSMQKDKHEGKLHQGINLLFPRVHISQANIHNIFGSYAGRHPGESWYIRDLKW